MGADKIIVNAIRNAILPRWVLTLESSLFECVPLITRSDILFMDLTHEEDLAKQTSLTVEGSW
jgi:hypothetical protein